MDSKSGFKKLMTILKTNFSPAFNITRLSHVVLTSRDLDKTRFFYEKGLGLEVTFQDSNFLFMRALEETSHHSLVFEKQDYGEKSKCLQIGYRVADESELIKAYDYFFSKNCNVSYIERPFQGKTIRVEDNIGTPIEI